MKRNQSIAGKLDKRLKSGITNSIMQIMFIILHGMQIMFIILHGVQILQMLFYKLYVSVQVIISKKTS